MCNSYQKRDITHFANGETIFIYIYMYTHMYVYGNSHNPSGLKKSEEDWNSGSCPHSYPYRVANSVSNILAIKNHFTIIFNFLFMTFLGI